MIQMQNDFEYEEWSYLKERAEYYKNLSLKKDYAHIDWIIVEYVVSILVEKIKKSGIKYDMLVGINRGGLIPAVMLSHKLELPMITMMPDDVLVDDKRYLIIDEIYDTGKTIQQIQRNNPDIDFAVLYHNIDLSPLKFYALKIPLDKWLIFPWEKQ
jgi:hypoxanthine phosphoribosyltransferase